MHRIPIVASQCLNAWLDPGWVCRWLSRILLLLMAVELATMPLTQHLWSWDKFLHGGQDFEFGLLMVVTCLCFLLLRTQHCRQNLGVMLTIGTFLVLILRTRQHIRPLLSRRPACEADEPPLSSASWSLSLPLLI